MRQVFRVAGTALRLLLVVVVLAMAVPGSGVRPATLTLTKLETARGFDAGHDVVWVLVLGEDDVGDTDAIQLLGIDTRSGAAAAIGFPRDTWVDLGSGGMGRINQAYKQGQAELAADVVADLVAIRPDYVLVTAGDGFVSMVDELGGVTVDSPLAFTTDTGNVEISKGRNELDSQEALRFAETRLFPVAGPGDFIRSANHQALLLGLLEGFQRQVHRKGFVELMGLSALEGLDTDASPVDLYRLLNALTSVDPTSTGGRVLLGREAEDPAGNQIIEPDRELGQRLGREAAPDATFETPCKPPV